MLAGGWLPAPINGMVPLILPVPLSMTTQNKPGAKAHITPAGLMFLAITSLGWGFNWPVTKYLLSELPPLTLRGGTGVIGAGLLAVLALISGQSLRVDPTQWPRLIVAAVLNVMGWMVLMGLALLWLPASEAALIAYTMPVWASLLAWFVLGERMTWLRVLALAMAFAGLAAIMGANGISASAAKLPGIVMALGRIGRVCARHRARQEAAAAIAADHGGGLADRLGMFSGGGGRLFRRDLALERRHRTRLAARGLFDRGAVLHCLCRVVCSTGAATGLGGGDRHHGGAGDRRRRFGDRAARAARPRPDRRAGVHAGGRGAGDAVVTSRASAAARISPLGLTFLAVTSVGWGLNFPIMKHLLTEWPPLSSRGLCGVAGAGLLALIAVAQGQRLTAPRRMWGRLLLVSLLTIGGWVAFMGLALLWLQASEAAVLGISIPVWVALLAWPILGERLSLARALSMMIALAGITVLIGGNGLDASLRNCRDYCARWQVRSASRSAPYSQNIFRWRCRRSRWRHG